MKKEELIATGTHEYLELATKFCADWFSRQDVVGPWFRGHANAEWSLVPKLLREGELDPETEDEIREEFLARAPNYTSARPANEWDWYFVMQHHGAPTRLIDWTDGALIALYFAIRDNNGCHDAAVWVLDPWWLNERVIHRDSVFSPSVMGLLRNEAKLIKKWLPPRFKKYSKLPEYPIAVYPSHIVSRISTQRSCFTVHGHRPDGLGSLARTKNARLHKIRIPSHRVRDIRKELEVCGIDEATVFPDLDGLARALGPRWNPEGTTSPHENAFTRLAQSKIHGVGVIAIRRIQKGQVLFPDDLSGMLWVPIDEIPSKPTRTRDLYLDFGVFKNSLCGCPPRFNCMTQSWYLNHSNEPNVASDEYYNFVAKRTIKAGEELTVDYSSYSEPPPSLKPKKRR